MTEEKTAPIKDEEVEEEEPFIPKDWVYDPVKADIEYRRIVATWKRPESEFEDEISAYFNEHGKSHERQKRVNTGIIDIFVYGQPGTIIELKRDDSVFSLMQALVQVKFYQTWFTHKPDLYVCFMPGRPISSEWHEIMKELKIGEMRVVYNEKSWRIEDIVYTHWRQF